MEISANQFQPATDNRHQLSRLVESGQELSANANDQDKTREAFQDFVGQTFFSQMIASLRSSQQPSAYFHGGRAEEVFQAQFDQVLSEELSDSSAEKIADPMFELFMLGRQR